MSSKEFVHDGMKRGPLSFRESQSNSDVTFLAARISKIAVRKWSSRLLSSFNDVELSSPLLRAKPFGLDLVSVAIPGGLFFFFL